MNDKYIEDSIQQRSKEQDVKIRQRAAGGDPKAKTLLELNEDQFEYNIVNLDEDKQQIEQNQNDENINY